MNLSDRLKIELARFNAIKEGIPLAKNKDDQLQHDIKQEIEEIVSNEPENIPADLIELENRSKDLFFEMKSLHDKLSELALGPTKETTDPDIIDRRKELAIEILSIEKQRMSIREQIKYFKEFGKLPGEVLEEDKLKELANMSTRQLSTKIQTLRSKRSRYRKKLKEGGEKDPELEKEIESKLLKYQTELELR